ncbi:uncharacterized protein LOC112194744 isoform X1 [Rosa chinensis]|uniref:uncharacterized protein LOC112194744 isoform X1 n=1 Tax=Rosa chinensis TaxID=74649 RepID=UPI001AD8D7E3|nr:uncharacterized protein LOC112194744 isoform X1 [Rosa chinensis]XP_040370573.1 uncharacterized protein LOC112194744 isoform X1 [Rosa chinensis]
MSSRNEEVLKLKNKIIECQQEALRLLQEKQGWPAKSNLMQQTKERAVADLTRQSTETSEFDKELIDLYKALKREEKSETNGFFKHTHTYMFVLVCLKQKGKLCLQLKDIFDETQASHEEHRKAMEKKVIEVECTLDTVDKRLSAMLENRVEMGKRLENLNVFYEAVYSTLKSKKSNSVSLVKEAQRDHPDGQNGPKMRKRRGSKKSQ